MKNQNDTPFSENAEDEVTVKRQIPLDEKDQDSTPESLEAFEQNQDAKNYQKLYEDTLQALKNEKENSLRLLAETENFRKRLIKEKEELVKFATEGLLQELLPCLDNLDMTLQHASNEQIKNDPVISGVNLVLKQFLQMLQKHGLEEISGLGQPFDPNLQEAIDTKQQDNTPDNQVIAVHRKGYRLHNRLLRASLVTVSRSQDA